MASTSLLSIKIFSLPDACLPIVNELPTSKDVVIPSKQAPLQMFTICYAPSVNLYERLRVATIYIQIALNDTFIVCLGAIKSVLAADIQNSSTAFDALECRERQSPDVYHSKTPAHYRSKHISAVSRFG